MFHSQFLAKNVAVYALFSDKIEKKCDSYWCKRFDKFHVWYEHNCAALKSATSWTRAKISKSLIYWKEMLAFRGKRFSFSMCKGNWFTHFGYQKDTQNNRDSRHALICDKRAYLLFETQEITFFTLYFTIYHIFR